MAKVLTKTQWRRRRRQKQMIARLLFILIILVVIAFVIVYKSGKLPEKWISNNIGKDTITQTLPDGKVIKEEFLTPNDYSRPQTRLKRINGVVVHYTANPGSTAENNHDYFESLADTQKTSVSSHYIIGLEGEIIQCIPLTEVAYASNNRNEDTVSIECCHPDKSGKFNRKTYDSLVSLTAALCIEFDLSKKDIIRHYDVTGKLCPLYFVEHKDAWKAFRNDVMDEVKKMKSEAAE